MRGGALPLICWLLLLTCFGVINAIWTGDAVQVGTVAAAVVSIGLLITALTFAAPESVHRGEPVAERKPRVLPRTSSGTVICALGFASLIFGFTFGHFPIYFGAGLMLAGASRLAVELHSQRRAGRTAERTERSQGVEQEQT